MSSLEVMKQPSLNIDVVPFLHHEGVEDDLGTVLGGAQLVPHLTRLQFKGNSTTFDVRGCPDWKGRRHFWKSMDL